MLLMTSSVEAQHNKEYIYGTVFTESGEKFSGFMRWGKEEFFWHDVFNSQKLSNKYIESPKETKKSRWIDFDWDLSSLWEDKYRTTSHLFSSFFGDIKTIYVKSSSKVKVEFKNGATYELNGGSNDIGTTINIMDYELGKIKLAWNKIEKIEFSQAPDSIDPPAGLPLYGKVSTRRKTFKGYIKWDLDERVGTDIMNGDSRHGDQEIPFKNIKEIEKLEEGVLLTFYSGRTLELDGSNDCDSDNRGIAIYEEGIGSVQVAWKSFQHIEFLDPPRNGIGYDDFASPEGIVAEINLFNGKTFSGVIVFDIDEMWEFELIDGKEDHIEYQIPFRNVERIVPKNSSYSMVYLKNGKELLLGEQQDVGRNNDGILLFKQSEKEPIHIPWDDIDEIIIK